MSTAKSRWHQQGNFCKYIWKQNFHQCTAYQQCNTKTEKFSSHIDTKGIAHLCQNLFYIGFIFFPQEQTAK